MNIKTIIHSRNHVHYFFWLDLQLATVFNSKNFVKVHLNK